MTKSIFVKREKVKFGFAKEKRVKQKKKETVSDKKRDRDRECQGIKMEGEERKKQCEMRGRTF